MGIYVGNKRYAPYIGDKRRRYMGGVKGLPYDAEIEYIESTKSGNYATQWIDTGIVPTNSTVCKLKFMNITTTSSAIFGYQISGTDKFKILNYRSIGYFEANNKQIINGSINVNTIYEIEVGNNYFINYTTGQTVTGDTYDLTFTGKLTLNRGTNATISANRWYYCQIYDGTTLLLDLIPVRKGTVGYMYDRVSGELFGNAGTSDFVLGPDKIGGVNP